MGPRKFALEDPVDDAYKEVGAGLVARALERSRHNPSMSEVFT